MNWRKHPHEGSKHGELPSEVDIKQQHKIVGVATLATLSAVLLLTVACIVTVCGAMPHFADNAHNPSSSVARNVGATRLQSVCPIRLSLPDLSQYGDSQYNESEGDLQSFARYGAFGDVYRASVHNVQDADDQSLILNTQASDTDSSALIADHDVNHDAQVLEGRLSRVASGTGIAASMISWATKGDVRGLAATTCSIPVMKQTFLVPEASEGTSLRLEAFNSAAKPTVVRVRAWSAQHGSTPLTFSTGSAFTVPAHSHAYFDLAAAAPRSGGLYVQVESEQTPVAAFVKVIHMRGLTVRGVDIIRALNSQSHTNILSGISEGDQTKVYVWPHKDGNVTLSWMNESGVQTIKELSLKSRHLQVIDLGKVPEHVHALSVTGSTPVAAMASITREGKDGQADVAFISASRSQGSSAIVSPVTADETTLYLASANDHDSSVLLQGFDASGVLVDAKRITVPSHAVVSIPAVDVSRGAVMFTVQSHNNITFSARISKSEVEKSDVAGVAWLDSQSLEPQQMQVYVSSNHHIVH
ncbi:hypothetical protein HMPREF3208_00573 [Gardnerella vaginalis]|uniref:Uncharacterized protein n=1 Tax=Gardnerella vaginalis TaxID=2702 RepID=A0A133NYW8_GARVA|nr:DUF5719 family protein [Gardnerella vaginalis]KXA21479.1 hypothetical protein HMPREF3208_00573 [Gardnerella vaginalis]